MAGAMQAHYEHALSKVSGCKEDAENGNHVELDKRRIRMAIVFRHGKRKQMKDNGQSAPSNLQLSKKETPEEKYIFGPMPDKLQEGEVYKRCSLVSQRAHS